MSSPEDAAVTMINNLKEKYGKGGMKGLLFDALLDGQAHGREDLMDLIGCSNKRTFANLVGALKKPKLVVADKSTVQMSDLCFPFGRPDGVSGVAL